MQSCRKEDSVILGAVFTYCSTQSTSPHWIEHTVFHIYVDYMLMLIIGIVFLYLILGIVSENHENT